MPHGEYVHAVVYDPNDAELRAAVQERMRSLAVGDYAPTRDDWTKDKPRHLPGQEWISRTPGWGWRAMLKEAGLTPRTPQNSRELADPMQAPLTEEERHACALRGLRERGW